MPRSFAAYISALVASFALLLFQAPVVFAAPAPEVALQAATTTVQVDLNTAAVEFGAEIRFQLRGRAEEPVRSVLFLYQVDDSPVQNTAVPLFVPGSPLVAAAYNWYVATVLVPGTEVRYQWMIETASGKITTTQEQSVTYSDTRFVWRQMQADQITVHFQAADPTAGQIVLDEVRKVVQRLRTEYGLSLEKPLSVYAYVRQQDYLTALVALRPTEFAIAADLDRVFVLAPTGTSNMTTAMQVLRREVAHAIFLQRTDNPYAMPPRWLAEGFSRYFGGEEISPQNYTALSQLAKANRLLPLRTLNGNFPTDENAFVLASYESLSVVKFIAETYGPEKLRALLAAVKDGNTTEDAIRKGLGVSLDQLESRWQNALKSGAAARTGSQSAQGGEPLGDGVIDRLFGPAVHYWQGIFGPYTRLVVIGGIGVVALGFLAIVASMVISIRRRINAEE